MTRELSSEDFEHYSDVLARRGGRTYNLLYVMWWALPNEPTTQHIMIPFRNLPGRRIYLIDDKDWLRAQPYIGDELVHAETS